MGISITTKNSGPSFKKVEVKMEADVKIEVRFK